MSSRGWFHSNTNCKAAEELLINSGMNGSFLVRASESKAGDFTISVRHNNEITHIKIQNDGDCYCLLGSPDPFATLQALIQHYQNSPKSIKEKSGGFIELLYPIRSNDPTSERWYHGQISSKEAERLLLAKGKQGNYLVRESQSQPGQFALAVRCKYGVQQIIIRYKDEKYDIASGPNFRSLQDLVEYYVQHPKLHDIKDQSPIKLIEPFQSTSFIASSVHERMSVLQKEYSRGTSGFREEFETLQRFDNNDTVYSCDAGKSEANKWKNRYKNILPYDHSRVFLKGGDPKDPGRDYINANYIDVELKSWKVRYLAAQGCLPSTTADFWTMVWQHDVAIIVMLTNEFEKGKNKCAKYWPDLGMSAEWDKIVVDNVLEQKTKTFTMRELKVHFSSKGKKAPRMFYQYHYTDWPDHGAPDDPGAILGLLNEIHAKHESCGRNTPIVIHCSAGIGRTGTVMVIDIIMHLLDEQGVHAEIDVQKTAQLLRAQRSGMIQTELQYRFVYEAVKHYVETEGKKEAFKIGAVSVNRPVYGNLDYSIPKPAVNPTAERRPIPDKPVPRPPASSMKEKASSGNDPQRSNALRRLTEPILMREKQKSKGKYS